MRVVELPQYLGEGQAFLPFRHQGVEGVDAAVRHGVAGRLFTLEDGREVFQSLLIPRGHVRDDVADRPGPRDARLQELRLGQAGVGRLERQPRFVESLEEAPSIHVRDLGIGYLTVWCSTNTTPGRRGAADDA